jgi:hypothetical protein
MAPSVREAPPTGDVEVLLGAEETEEVRLRDACTTGDGVGRGAVVAGAGELLYGGGEDVLAPLLCGLSRRGHG